MPPRRGLSPHVRGNPAGARPGRAPPRSIPACTGKPRAPHRSSAPSWVYPRMYGETCVATLSDANNRGLSPHVRGNLAKALARVSVPRSIPACTGKPRPWYHEAMMLGVYPRMYGETRCISGAIGPAPGLSPHVRGNPRCPPQRRGLRGSIPACTGKPDTDAVDELSMRVYPRMYGETANTSIEPRGIAGLSPHVRGNPRGEADPLPDRRSIPACTGKPPVFDAGRDTREVYPRMYGETGPRPAGRRAVRGLSPHVRGNRRNASKRTSVMGSIPACTGKPPEEYRIGEKGEVYPRMYGETPGWYNPGVTEAGLSPHVRGNPKTKRRARSTDGSIPACTGKPEPPAPMPALPRVYPRMYGETHQNALTYQGVMGLSPHVRGNLRVFAAIPQIAGSIPACTGKPSGRRHRYVVSAVYPRMYGETDDTAAQPVLLDGLSPHVRGNRRSSTRRSWRHGSIPACTGKPAAGLLLQCVVQVYPRMYGETVGGRWKTCAS